jgi:hypothetical protein
VHVTSQAGLESRYQDYQACPWDVSVEPNQVYSGVLLPSEHGALFLVDDRSLGRSAQAYRQWLLTTPRWAVAMDDKAQRSFAQVSGADFNPLGSSVHVTLRGWRTEGLVAFNAAYSTHLHLLFVDEFTRRGQADHWIRFGFASSPLDHGANR